MNCNDGAVKLWIHAGDSWRIALKDNGQSGYHRRWTWKIGKNSFKIASIRVYPLESDKLKSINFRYFLDFECE